MEPLLPSLRLPSVGSKELSSYWLRQGRMWGWLASAGCRGSLAQTGSSWRPQVKGKAGAGEPGSPWLRLAASGWAARERGPPARAPSLSRAQLGAPPACRLAPPSGTPKARQLLTPPASPPLPWSLAFPLLPAHLHCGQRLCRPLSRRALARPHLWLPEPYRFSR